MQKIRLSIKFDLRGCFEAIRGCFWKCYQMIQIWFYYYPGIKMTKNKPQWPQYKLDLRGWCGGCWGWAQKMTAFWSKCMNFILTAFHWPHIVQFEAAWPQITWILRHFRSEAVEAVSSNLYKNWLFRHKFPLLRIPKIIGFWLQWHLIMKNC